VGSWREREIDSFACQPLTHNRCSPLDPIDRHHLPNPSDISISHLPPTYLYRSSGCVVVCECECESQRRLLAGPCSSLARSFVRVDRARALSRPPFELAPLTMATDSKRTVKPMRKGDSSSSDQPQPQCSLCRAPAKVRESERARAPSHVRAPTDPNSLIWLLGCLVGCF